MGFCQGGCCEFMDWFSEQHTFIFNGLVRRFCAAFLFCVLFNYVSTIRFFRLFLLCSYLWLSRFTMLDVFEVCIPEYHKLTLFCRVSHTEAISNTVPSLSI